MADVMSRDGQTLSKFAEVVWVYDDAVVYVRYGQPVIQDGVGVQKLLRCRVAAAAGDAARVVNEKRGFDQWQSVRNLLVPVGDPMSRPGDLRVDVIEEEGS